jgi:hypothetical protein
MVKTMNPGENPAYGFNPSLAETLLRWIGDIWRQLLCGNAREAFRKHVPNAGPPSRR